jgi:hypothetical protein
VLRAQGNEHRNKHKLCCTPSKADWTQEGPSGVQLEVFTAQRRYERAVVTRQPKAPVNKLI